ncbi:hypothetical protein EDC04DRAFT_2619411 [Pisolithus marmoratus]|nr:hypothetical protein EDC04DRAFT_2619411 [Pisolithus marmoratus]
MASSIISGTSPVTLPSTAPSTSAITPSTQQSASELSATTTPASASSSTVASPSSLSTVSASTSALSTMSSTSNAATTSSNEVTSQPITTSTIPSTSSSPSITEQTSIPPTSSTSPPSTTSTTSVSPSTSTSSPPSSPSSTPQSTSSSTPSTTPVQTQGSSSLTPATTSDPVATVTGQTTIFVTTTNVEGQTVTSAPSIVTQLFTSTNGAGFVTTVTEVVVNPTLASNNSTSATSSFFTNTGAVAGVFVVVGLAATSIILWILFALRRRYRMRQIEHDSAIQAAVAAAGFNRVPLDDDEDDHGRTPHSHSQFSVEMGQRGSYMFGPLPTAPPLYDDGQGGFNPYADYPTSRQGPRHTGGYVPTRTASPPPGAERPGLSVVGTDEFGSNRDRKSSFGHTPTYSAGSFEPLLSGYGQTSEPAPNGPPTPPPRNPKRLADASNVHNQRSHTLGDDSSNGGTDDRLDPDIRKRTRSNSLGTANLRDDEDYSRPVLTVRNMPDAHSERSI